MYFHSVFKEITILAHLLCSYCNNLLYIQCFFLSFFGMCFNAAVEAPYTLLYDCQYLYTCFLDYLLEKEMKFFFLQCPPTHLSW